MIYTILILGSKGQLGRSILAVAQCDGMPHKILRKDLDELDITDSEGISAFLSTHKVDIIVNCAAYTAVDQAEEEAELAFQVNGAAVARLAKICHAKDIYLFHISTDYVFDGEASVPYHLGDTPHPRSVYGESKLAGEQAMMDSGCRGTIIRTSWLYSPFGHNFVKTILRIGQEKKEIRVVDDQYGSPTNALDLARAILTFIEKGLFNRGTEIYHFSNRGITTWYGFAREIIRFSGYGAKVQPIPSAEFPTKAERPRYSVLDISQTELLLGYPIPEWRESLEKTVGELL